MHVHGISRGQTPFHWTRRCLPCRGQLFSNSYGGHLLSPKAQQHQMQSDRLRPAQSQAADTGMRETAADAGSALMEDEPSLWRRLANIAEYGNEYGYHMGPCHWQPLVDHTDGERVVEEISRLNGAVSVWQHGPFRALRFGDSLQSVTITEDEDGQQISSARQVAFGYIRAMAAAAATFSCSPHSDLDDPAALFKGGTVVCLGVGGGALPALLSLSYPSTSILAIDIDPVVLQLATKYMSLSAPDLAASGIDNLSVQQMDAKICVSRLIHQGVKPQAIFLDCYDMKGQVPPYLTGPAFLESCFRALPQGGLLVANLFNNEAGGYARARFASFACLMQHEVGEGNLYSIKAVNQEVNVILVGIKQSNKEARPFRRKEILQAAFEGGAAAGFLFSATAELQDIFLVHATDVQTFHETAV